MKSTKELWAKINAFDIDDPTSTQPFSVRLAKENGWTLRFAQRAIEEYKRFVFLTCAADHVVCPSEEVDAAWHLHLCYTRSYWQDLCRDILGKQLHHDPTRGGQHQLEYHRTIYSQTLASYQAHFGELPPTDLWPDVDSRFAHGGSERHVDMSRYWILPKPSLRWFLPPVTRKSMVGLGAFVMLPTFGMVWNPLDMTGKQFLELYIPLLIVSLIGAIVLRRALQPMDTGGPEPELNPYQLAVLSGKEDQAMQLVLAELVHTEHIEICNDDGTTLKAVKPISERAQPIVRTIYQAIEQQPEATLATAWGAGRPKAAQIAADLEKEGLLAKASESAPARWLPTLLMAGVMLLGIVKLGVGISRDKPVFFLVLLLIAGLIATCFIARGIWLTPRGKRVLKKYQSNYQKASQSSNLPENYAGLMMQWGLYGLPTMMIAGGAVSELHSWMNPHANRFGSGSGCSSGCGGVGGCGGGCGGGGCGGGCGGCGGD